jgi:hypothetical protein
MRIQYFKSICFIAFIFFFLKAIDAAYAENTELIYIETKSKNIDNDLPPKKWTLNKAPDCMSQPDVRIQPGSENPGMNVCADQSRYIFSDNYYQGHKQVLMNAFKVIYLTS